MYVQYGTYKHAANSVSIAVSRERWSDTDGVLRGYIEKWTLTGWLKATGADLVANLTTQIAALIVAYAADGGNLGLYEDDDTATPHLLTSASCVGGVRITRKPSFPKGDQAEYATYRSFTIEAEARVETAALGTMAWQDSVTMQGTGDGEFVVRTPLVGNPVRQDTSEKTPVKIRQTGSAMGRTGYPSPSAPVSPANEHKAARSITYQNPKYYEGTLRDYVVSWSYEFEFTTWPGVKYPTSRS